MLRNPSNDELSKTKFCGIPLGNYIWNSLQNVCLLAQYICTKLQEVSDIKANSTKESHGQLDELLDIYVYGEWIHRDCQTSDSKFDKYNYKKRGLVPGHLYAFGVGMALKPEVIGQTNCKMSSIEEFINLLSITDDEANENSFVVQKCIDLQENPFLILTLNSSLKTLLNRFGLDVVPILGEYRNVQEGILEFGTKLIPPATLYEGLIFTGPLIGEAIKMKNPCAEGKDPLNASRLEKLERHIKETSNHSPFDNNGIPKNVIEIFKKLVEYHDLNSQPNDTFGSDRKNQFQRAYQSAKTKFPHFSDERSIKSNDALLGPHQGELPTIDTYKNCLRGEMIKDLKCSYEGKKNNNITSFHEKELDEFICDMISNELD